MFVCVCVVCGPPTLVASPIAEHRLQTHRLSGHGSQAQPLRGMWDLPRPGHEPMSPASAGGLSTTAPPGKPMDVGTFGGGIILPPTDGSEDAESHDLIQLCGKVIYFKSRKANMETCLSGHGSSPEEGGGTRLGATAAKVERSSA